MKVPKHILPIIVFSQFCCTSLWFAGNGVMTDLAQTFSLTTAALGHLTSIVQLGFISGTLVFATLALADRISPSKLFFVSALLGATTNLATLFEWNELFSLLVFRFLTGFFLAGIYPVGMKIAADHYDKGLGKSLGFLVGALVLGTAFPHLLKTLDLGYDWQFVLVTTSLLAAIGGTLMRSLVPDGPFRKPGVVFNNKGFILVFKNAGFRRAAFGYFGHMWELYAFWTYIPIVLLAYMQSNSRATQNVPLWSFYVIGIGTLGCILAGYLSQSWGTRKTAIAALSISGICCLMSPLLFLTANTWVLFVFLTIWGLAVIADSPLFSTLVAQNAEAENKGTALTIVNCVGFALTIVSIQLLGGLKNAVPYQYLMLPLLLGPVFGLIGFRKTASDPNL